MEIKKSPKIAIAGAVNSSLTTLLKLIEHNCNVVAVLSLNPKKSKPVSGYKDLKKVADKNDISSLYFDNINDENVYAYLKEKEIDLLFIIGLSQIVKKTLLDLPSIGSIGFHPTKLPQGRGRGAVAWLILGKASGAATFFLMDEGMDSGNIVHQVEFEIEDNDYAIDVIEKIKTSIGKALDEILPKLNEGILKSAPQDESKVTFLGRRKPKDGLIDWRQTSEEIFTLIRASSKPLPGAFTYYKNEKIIVQRAKLEKRKYIGVPGRIIKLVEEDILVSTANGALWLTNYEIASAEKIEFKPEQDFTYNRK